MQLRPYASPAVLAPAAAPWTPQEIAADLALWWDASLAASITLDGNGRVQEWEDRISGVVADRTASQRPDYDAANGFVYCTNEFRCLTVPNIPAGGDHLWVALVMMMDMAASAASSGKLIYINGDTDATGKHQPGIYYTRIGALKRCKWHSPGSSNQVALASDDGTFEILVSRLDGGVHKASLNGGAEGTAGSGIVLDAASGNDGRLGDSASGAHTWSLRHVLIGKAALSDAVKQKIEGWAAWDLSDAGDSAIVNALPAGHPYKSARP